MIGLILFLACFPIAFASAFLTARWLRPRFPDLPKAGKILIGGLVGVVAPVAYLWIWQSIEVAQRAATGDTSDYMGPMVMLVYGFPFFLLSCGLSFVFAAFGAMSRA